MILRWIFGSPIAAIITAGLFILMAALISMDKGPLPSLIENPNIRILAEPPPEPRPPVDTKADALPDPPDPIELTHVRPNPKPGPVVSPPSKGRIEVEPGGGANTFPAPLIRHAPPYPENCRGKGVQGRVVVQFDVTPDGSVTNVQILETPNRCFNRTVIRAVSRWKYPPSNNGGRKTMRYGVVEVFDFQLTE